MQGRRSCTGRPPVAEAATRARDVFELVLPLFQLGLCVSGFGFQYCGLDGVAPAPELSSCVSAFGMRWVWLIEIRDSIQKKWAGEKQSHGGLAQLRGAFPNRSDRSGLCPSAEAAAEVELCFAERLCG